MQPKKPRFTNPESKGNLLHFKEIKAWQIRHLFGSCSIVVRYLFDTCSINQIEQLPAKYRLSTDDYPVKYACRQWKLLIRIKIYKNMRCTVTSTRCFEGIYCAYHYSFLQIVLWNDNEGRMPVQLIIIIKELLQQGITRIFLFSYFFDIKANKRKTAIS